MDDLQEEYSQLKIQVVSEAGNNFSLEEVKDFFANNINSKRSLSRVRTLLDVIELLEKRDLLRSREVKPLHDLGVMLHNSNIKELVRDYKKLYLNEMGEITCICGLTFPYQQYEVFPLAEQRANENLLPNNRNNSIVDSLSEATENVSLNIGKKWGVLARELGVRECEIETCYETYPNDPIAQARLALDFWRRLEQANATIERLDRALEARLCKLKGIGSHLRRPFLGLSH